MLLTCESCETIFRIESAQLKAAGQQVRCSVCQHVWAPEIEDPLASEPKVVSEALSVLRKPMLIVASLVLAFSVISFNRGIITAYLPSTINVFDMSGLAIKPDLEALEVRDLKASFQGDTLRISGLLANKTSLRTHAAPLQLSILDSDGVVLHSQRLSPVDKFIDGFAETDFFIQLTIEATKQAEVRIEPLAIRLTTNS